MSRARAPRSFVLDPVDKPRTHFVAIPRQAPIRFVEMRMTFDKPRQYQRTLAVLAHDLSAALQVRTDFFDPSAADSNINRGTVRQTDMGDQQAIEHLNSWKQKTQSADFKDRVHLYRRPRRKRRHAHRGPRMPASFAEHREHEIGGSVDDFRHIRITRCAIHEPAHPMTTNHAIEITIECKVKCCEQVESANLRCPLSRFKILLRADRTGVPNLTFPFANLSSEEDQRARA